MAISLGLSLSMFWGNDYGIGEICDGCEDPIYGTVYFPIIQIGSAIDLNFVENRSINICQDCFSEIPQDDND